MKKKLTKSDEENLSKCPYGWFLGESVWPKVKRIDYSLGRLVDSGVLEMKWKENEKYYRKISVK